MVEKSSSVATSGGNLPYISPSDEFQRYVAVARENAEIGQKTPDKQEPQKQVPEASNWTRFWGGLKTVGGVLETGVGGALTFVGAATSEFGIGVPLMVVGGAITLHGADVTVSGARTAWYGREYDTFTSQGMQGLGVKREWANVADAGVSMMTSFGGGAILRGPRVAKALTELANRPTSISLAYKPGLPLGHNMVGINAGQGTQWSHLVIDSSTIQNVKNTPFIKSATAHIMPGRLSSAYKTVTIPVSALKAKAAANLASSQLRTSAPYRYFVNDCATYANNVLREAGILTLPRSTPSLTFFTTSLQSPQAVRATVLPFVSGGVNSTTAAEAGLRK